MDKPKCTACFDSYVDIQNHEHTAPCKHCRHDLDVKCRVLMQAPTLEIPYQLEQYRGYIEAGRVNHA